MKPATTKAFGRSAAAAAKTAVRAELGWLRGYPTGPARRGELPWTVLPPLAPRAVATELVVDRQRLREANLALATLPRRFPRALPRVVGDVGDWLERGRRVLGWLGAAVHEGEPLPALAQSDDGALAPLVEALGWVHFLDPDPAARERALTAARARADRLTVLLAHGRARGVALDLALRLLDLAADEPRGPASGVIDLLGQEGLWAAPLEVDPGKLEQVIAALRRVAKGRGEAAACPEFERPVARLGEVAFALAADALTRDRGGRDRGLTMLVDVLPLALVELWAAWWDDVALHAGTAQRLLGEPRRAQKERLRAVADALRALLHRRPPTVRDGGVRHAVTQAALLSPLAAERLHALLGRVEPLATRTSFETARLDLARTVVDEPRSAERALAVAVALPERARVTGPVMAWLVELGGELGRLGPAVTTALRSLAEAKAPGTEDWDRLDLLAEHVRLHGDGEAAAAFLRAVGAGGVAVPWPLGKATVTLCGLEPARVSAIIAALAGASWSSELAGALVALAKEPAARALLVDALLAREGARIRRLCVRASLVRGLGRLADVSQPVARDDASEAEAPGAEPGAEPGADAWARELEALERLAPGADARRASRMRGRAARLRERLAGRGTPTPARRARAAARRDARRARRLALDAWEAALDERAREALTAWLGASPPVEWLACPRRLAVLAGLCALPARWRPLARRVLRARLLSPAPWDLRDAPGNAAFLARLRAQGVDPGPWLDGLPERAWTAASGRKATLRLEDDPLEVLQMGAAFGTCLSPGESNFFAALVDAADVNKRVLYARADSGAIVGRCLLALTAEGDLITYHPYCHEVRDGFPEQARRFVEDLVRAMNTTVAASGEVPTLLAGDWYCDEPEDLLGVSARLDEALRRQLAAAAPAAVPALLEGALGRALDAPTVARALELPEVHERPELALGLAPLVLTLRTSARVRVRALERLLAAGARDAALAVARAIRPDDLEPYEVAVLARALVTLGRAREVGELLRRTVRGPLEAEHHEALGLACEALYRRGAAREHFRAAAGARGCFEARERCRARLGVEEARVGA
jgi:hypothetical protein